MKPEALAENIPAEWVDLVCEVVHRDRLEVRAGAQNRIEIKNGGRWGKLMLPGNLFSFARTVERDNIVERLQKCPRSLPERDASRG